MLSPNLLYRTRTYLVGHMENVSANEGQTWRDWATQELSKLGVVVFDPYKKPFVTDVEEGPDIRSRFEAAKLSGDFDFISERMRQIRIFDLNLVDRSDFIIANIKPSLASWGSTEEVVTAVKMKKPVYLVVEGGKTKCPLWIFGMFPHKYIFNTVAEVIEELKGIDSGKTETDGRWRLLKKEFR